MDALTAQDAAAHERPKLKVFVSYSRRDLAFVERLVAALDSRDIDVIIDRRNLPLAVEFQKELLGFIRQADAVVYVVSTASTSSPWCAWEVEQVQLHSKRLVPVVAELVEDERVHEGIRKINYVFFTGEYATSPAFESRADDLARALKTDLAWIKEHTRIGELARHWEEHDHDRGLLLRGRDLDDAEAWRSRHPAEAPPLTNLHREFILASRTNATRRQRLVVVGSLSAAVVALALAGVALWQRSVATENARQATINEASALSQLSLAETSKGNTTHAMELALRGFDTTQKAGVQSPEVETALYQALWRHRELRRRKLDIMPIDAWFDGPSGAVRVLTGDRVVTLDRDLRQTNERARVNVKKTAANGEVSEEPEERPVAQPQAVPLSWSKDKTTLSIAVPGMAGAPKKVQVLKQADLPFTPDGAWLSRGDKDGDAIVVLKSGELSDDSARLAVVGNDGTVTKIEVVESRVRQIDASGRIIFFCQAWSNGYFIKTSSPGHQIETQQYVKGGCGRNSISYSLAEDLVAFTPSSNSGDIEQPELVDAQTGIQRAKLGGHTSAIAAIDISPDGSTVLTVSEDGVVRLWRARVGADDRLVRKHSGMVLSGKYDAAVGDGRLSSDYSDPVHDVFLGDRGLLKKEAKAFDLVSRADDSLLIASSDNEIIAFSRDRPTVPLFRKPLSAKLTDVVHARGSSSLFTADETGAIRRWSIADGSSVQVFATEHEPILLLQWTNEQAETLDVVTPARLLRVDPNTGRAEQKALLPDGIKPDSAAVTAGYLSYCKQRDDGDNACELLSIATGAIVLRAICLAPLRVDERLAVAYCEGRGEALPILADISGTVREIAIFPDANTVAATGLSAHAAISLAPIDGCRRAFISLGGGIADNPYRGEGLLYDFAQRREVARTKGDPSTDYQSYGDGAGLPAFCDAPAAAEYARDLLKITAAQ